MALSRRRSHNLTSTLPRQSSLLMLMTLMAAAWAYSPQSSSYFTSRQSKHTHDRGAPSISPQHCRTALRAVDKPAGAFFNPVPNDDNDNTNKNNSEKETDDVNHAKANKNENVNDNTVNDLDTSLERLLKERNAPSLASQPSTINGVPTAQASGVGFGISTSKKSKQKGIITTTTTTKIKTSSTYIGIGPPDHNNNNNQITPQRPIINDVTQPEYDDQGYTLYANEETGEKSRVFEALVDYPCEFTMKIVGANEGTFVEEMLQVVADSCQVKDLASIRHKTRSMGKWMSLTVEAPVQNAKMLYELYENVDKDPRVKFKF